jgi:hypothetical protein
MQKTDPANSGIVSPSLLGSCQWRSCGKSIPASSRLLLRLDGDPQVSREWRRWKNVDPVNRRIENATDFPVYGA